MNVRELTGNAAFDLLLALEEAVLLNGGEAPKNADAKDQWSGVRCLVAGMNVVVPLQQVGEILEPRSITSIPGCADWVKGLMNVRGRLLPVFGVSEFFGGTKTRGSSFQIILVEQGAIFCGIVVDKVHGVQKFFQHDFKEGSVADALEGLREFVGVFTVIDGNNWYQLDISGLATRMSHANPAVSAASEYRMEAAKPRPAAPLAETHTATEA